MEIIVACGEFSLSDGRDRCSCAISDWAEPREFDPSWERPSATGLTAVRVGRHSSLGGLAVTSRFSNGHILPYY